MAEKLRVMKLVARNDVLPNLTIFRFETETEFVFESGQFCVISRGGVKRAYSIFSSPQDPYIELLIKLVPEGALTTQLWDLSLGDEVELFQPRGRGNFLFDPTIELHAMFATGTGIAPFRSMIRQYAHEGKWKFYVFHGVSYADELSDCCYEMLEAKQVIYVPSVSRPNDERNSSWKGATGRLPEQAESAIKQFSLTPENSRVYACGQAGMITGIKSLLEPMKFKIKEEKY